MTTQDSFLPDNYTAPTGGGKNYFKLEKGENRFRILSKPIIGWLDWQDKKPLRFRHNEKPNAPIDPKKPIKHFWAFVIWNYKTECIQVMEITQVTIQNAIQALSRDADWGNPFMYDIKVTKTGEGMETEYTINPVPHKPVTKDVQEALVKAHINLDALYDGGDPFDTNSHVSDPFELESDIKPQPKQVKAPY